MVVKEANCELVMSLPASFADNISHEADPILPRRMALREYFHCRAKVVCAGLNVMDCRDRLEAGAIWVSFDPSEKTCAVLL